MKNGDWLQVSMPKEEVALLSEAYQQASVILEYGSGGSTALAAGLKNKLIFSVESDFDWALRVQNEIYRRNLPSAVTMYPVDIGPTGAWGRPVDESQWRKFNLYATAIWSEPFFRSPDVVLIDGRSRLGCLATVALAIRKKTTVLFDDYTTRNLYQKHNVIAEPDIIVGRMAKFTLEPSMIDMQKFSDIINMFSLMSTVATTDSHFYD